MGGTRGMLLVVAAGGLVVGLSAPAAAREASALINGRSIAIQSIPGNRLQVNGVTGRQVRESTLGTVPSAKTAVTAKRLAPLVWHKLTLLNGWGPALNGRVASYAVDSQGIVHLRGSMYNITPTNSILFDLPLSLAPATAIRLPDAEQGTVGVLVISVDGSVAMDNSGTAQFISLDGLTWDTTR
jgi:hypothetical protein